MSAANKNDSNRLSGKRKRDKDCRSLLLDAVLAKLTPLCAPAAVPNDVEQRIISKLDRIMTAEQDSKDVVDNKDKWVYECVIELLAEIKDEAIQQKVIQQKDAIIQQKAAIIQQKVIQQKAAIIQQKAAIIQQKDAIIQQKAAIIQQKDEIIQQKDAIIQQKAAIIQQKDAIIQQKDAIIQQKDAIIQQKAAIIQQKAAIIQQKDAIIQSFIVDRLMDYYDTCDESLVKQRECMKLKPGRDCERGSNTRTKHIQASCDASGDFAMDPIKVKTAGHCHIPSFLLIGRWPATYANVFEVQKYVERGLDDAVAYINWLLSKSIGIKTSLIVRKEASIFSNKPDYLVVYYESSQLLPILCVETKMPSDEAFTSTTVGGQLFDYLMVAKMWHGRPTIGVLTTFNKSKIAWDVDCQNEAKNKERLSPEAIKKTVTILAPQEQAEGKSPETAKTTASTKTPQELAQAPSNVDGAETPAARRVDAKTGKKTDSPPDHIEFADAAIHNQSDTQIGASFDDPHRQIKYSSTTYDAWQLFTVFCHGIIASLNMGRQKHKIKLAKKLLKGQTVLVLQESRHAWHTLLHDYSVEENPWQFKDKSNLEFIVTGLVGFGATSRVWTAVVETDGCNHKRTRQCSTCVVKYWIKTYDPETAANLTNAEINTESDKTTKREVENYKKIYRDLFFDVKVLVGRVKLDRWCVVLPLFRPIEKADRLDVLNGIQSVLECRFYNMESGTSYQFSETDRCWRHIGRWQTDKIVLFDLANLEKKIIPFEEHKEYINEHIQTLKDIINT